MRAQPRRHRDCDVEVLGLRTLVTSEPTLNLTQQKALRFTQGVEADPPSVDVVQIGQGVDEHFADLTVHDRIAATTPVIGDHSSHHCSAAPFHYEERSTD